MLYIFLTAIIAFFTTSLFGYVVHRALHQTWAGRFNQAHMTHHLVMYPCHDYLSDVYRSAGKDNTVKTFAICAIPLVAIPILLVIFGVIPLSLTVTALLVMGIMGFLHNYIHDAFHIRNHFLTRIPVIRAIFGHWNALHYLHHIDMQKNFGIFLFHWDHIFRTYWKATWKL